MLYPGIEERLKKSLQKTQPYVRISQAAHLLVAKAKEFRENHLLQEEIFGPATLLVECENEADVLKTIDSLPGQLTATVHVTPDEEESSRAFLEAFTEKAGRVFSTVTLPESKSARPCSMAVLIRRQLTLVLPRSAPQQFFVLPDRYVSKILRRSYCRPNCKM